MINLKIAIALSLISIICSLVSLILICFMFYNGGFGVMVGAVGFAIASSLFLGAGRVLAVLSDG